MSFNVSANPNKGTRQEAANKQLLKYSPQEVAKAVSFHESIDGYAPTPLCSLDNLAKKLGVSKIYVKDESYRFGLNAFKVLGGSYAIGTYLAEKLGVDISELPYKRMVSDEVKAKLGDVTFISATDGNHGRGVAWMANKLGQKCIIHMPKGSAHERLENIRALGATADITNLNYDDAVRMSSKEADENGWVLVQDTSWQGYEKIPQSIIRGYMTMLAEADKQLGSAVPTHVFVQAGVGALATAVVSYCVNRWGSSDKVCPKLLVVEPNNAACIFETLTKTDGKIHAVGGDLKTIMAGLACGEPVTVGVDVLLNSVDFVASVPDYAAAQGMRVLSSPAKDAAGAAINSDPRIISGESGAAAIGFAYELLSNAALNSIKTQLGIGKNSKLFFISTEGDTDRANYDEITQNGAWSRNEAAAKNEVRIEKEN
ncbi:MAG: diaminopropionate ammonia-lyase [Termitinemataceae bacterium]|nr:MAG: diaminopropionate ammonia-lyase [Termitinemataceae bacterium]